MIEDKLTRDERRRLECLNMAVAGNYDKEAHNIVERAKKFEEFVKGNVNG